MKKQAKTWNPFRRDYWTKENLLGNTEEYEKAKEEYKKAITEIKDNLDKGKKEYKKAITEIKDNLDKEKSGGSKFQDIGKKISGVGWKLTLMFTIPIILTLLFGMVGMVIGAIIFLVVLAGMFKS
ncbi:MAG: hypothetical protein DDT41_01665 [candidate division WS2 bacterium]|nr:hypothetical protein [Candidatus Psychracetigena formicireducens]